MKRLIAVLLMCIMAFSCVACSPKKADDGAGNSDDKAMSQRDQALKELEDE